MHMIWLSGCDDLGAVCKPILGNIFPRKEDNFGFRKLEHVCLIFFFPSMVDVKRTRRV